MDTYITVVEIKNCYCRQSKSVHNIEGVLTQQQQDLVFGPGLLKTGIVDKFDGCFRF